VYRLFIPNHSALQGIFAFDRKLPLIPGLVERGDARLLPSACVKDLRNGEGATATDVAKRSPIRSPSPQSLRYLHQNHFALKGFIENRVEEVCTLPCNVPLSTAHENDRDPGDF
jgi:hypothetical protein